MSNLDRQCVEKLKGVRFGAYSSTERVMEGIRATLSAGMPLSDRQRLALYAICWRYRGQIGDLAFTARVLIVERLLIEMSEVIQLGVDRPKVRAWRSVDVRDGLPV